MQKIDQDKIVILDFGSQYTQLIARRIREIGVLSEIVSCEISPKELLKLNPRGIIFSGGPESVNSKFKPKFNVIVFARVVLPVPLVPENIKA